MPALAIYCIAFAAFVLYRLSTIAGTTRKRQSKAGK